MAGGAQSDIMRPIYALRLHPITLAGRSFVGLRRDTNRGCRSNHCVAAIGLCDGSGSDDHIWSPEELFSLLEYKELAKVA
jgi:hypothetical protein